MASPVGQFGVPGSINYGPQEILTYRKIDQTKRGRDPQNWSLIFRTSSSHIRLIGTSNKLTFVCIFWPHIYSWILELGESHISLRGNHMSLLLTTDWLGGESHVTGEPRSSCVTGHCCLQPFLNLMQEVVLDFFRSSRRGLNISYSAAAWACWLQNKININYFRVAGAALFGWSRSRSRFLVRLRLLLLLQLYCKYFIFTGP